jgi:ATP-dependent RNA helicase RhlE
VFYGGVSINPQYDQASRGLDILVATPGRLLDHLHQGTVSLSELQILVLDEADRMLDMGFIHDIKRIMAKLPKERQTLFFSATFAKEIKELADTLLKAPVLIEVAKPNSTADKIEQLAYRVDSQRKREMLSYLIGSRQWKQVLIFSRTKHGADRLAKQLRLDGIEAGAIHGDKSQGARTKALDDFKNNRLSVLVATDIAARGLDIEELPIVVNYDLPQVAEDYVHRIGRTGRAGNSGMAISLITPDDLVMLQAIEKLTKQVITQQVVPGYEHDPKMNHSSKKADAEEERVQKVASRNKQLAKEKAKLRAQAMGKK